MIKNKGVFKSAVAVFERKNILARKELNYEK